MSAIDYKIIKMSASDYVIIKMSAADYVIIKKSATDYDVKLDEWHDVIIMRTVCAERVSKALFIRHLRWKHAVHSLPVCDVFHNPYSNCYLLFFMHGLCVVYMWLEQTSVNGNTTNLEPVLYLCPALDWRWSDILLLSTFTRGKTLTFMNMQKIFAEVDAHNKWISSSSVLVKSSTNSDARPANHNAQSWNTNVLKNPRVFLGS